MNTRVIKAMAASALCIALFMMATPIHSKVGAGPQKDDIQSIFENLKENVYRVAFDMSHAEIFSPVEEGALNYSSFYNEIKDSGATVFLNREKVAGETLSGFDTYIIAGPAAGFTASEIEALKQFVSEGGSLLLLLHISSPVAVLSESLGIIVSNHVIADESASIDGQSQDFYVTRFSPHPVTEGLSRIAVFGSWGLMAARGGKVVAETSDTAWADLNRNRALDKDEPVQAFGIVAVSEYGKGRAVVVADDAPFANTFYERADNRKLAVNILNWLRNK